MPFVWIVVWDEQLDVSLLTTEGDFDTFHFETWSAALEFVHLNRPDWPVRINHWKEV